MNYNKEAETARILHNLEQRVTAYYAAKQSHEQRITIMPGLTPAQQEERERKRSQAIERVRREPLQRGRFL